MHVEKVRIGIAVPPGMTAANGYFSAAAALGYDRDEGLAFEPCYAIEPGRTARALCAGECDIASLNTTVGVLGRQEGLPMVAVYGKARRTHRWFAVVPESPARSLSDLRGKAVACDFEDLRPLGESALVAEGVGRDEVTFVPWRGSGMQTREMLEPLRRGEIDAVFLIDWNHGDFIAEGLPMRRLPSVALDRIRLSSCIWTSESYLRQHADAIGGSGRALAEVTAFALESPEAAVRLMWQQEPETRPAPAEHARILRRDVEIMKARLDCFRLDPTDSGARWGDIDGRELDAWQDFLMGAGTLQRRLDTSAMYTTAFVDRFNDFDEAEVRRRAREFRRPMGAA